MRGSAARCALPRRRNPPNPAGTGPETPAAVGYREMLQNQSAPIPSPAPQPQPAGTPSNNLVMCPRLRLATTTRGSSIALNHDCTSLLSTATKNCTSSSCRASIPTNARYCTECGSSQASSGTAPVGRMAQFAVPRGAPLSSSGGDLTCPGCRAQVPRSAVYCNQCGTNVR